MHKVVKRYFIDAMSAMAQGLFASLLIGTIIRTIATQLLKFGDNSALSMLLLAGDAACNPYVVGAAMAVGIGKALDAKALVLFSLASVGALANVRGGAGGPFSVLVIAIVSCEVGGLVTGKTKVDIIVSPLVTILTGCILSGLAAKQIGAIAASLGSVVMWATTLRPFVMGVIISVVVGVALTLPISSAAICAALSLTGLAGGAAVAGCCAQMVGFAVISFRDNGISGLLSQGLGTSMLQMPNIIKNPRIWIPPTLAAAITGPLATCLFRLQMNGVAVSSGMGTCGMVGPIGVITGWYSPSQAAISYGAKAIAPTALDWLALLLICIVLPAILSIFIAKTLRKLAWIKAGDMKI